MSEIKGTKALELWCKRLVKDCPDVTIENMTTSWRNGMAFCALVHHFRPDLIDLSKLKPENIYENNQLAYSIAEKHLGIPALLDPEDMVENDVPDRLSVLTYLSQFYQRLGHTVNSKVTENDTKVTSLASMQPSTPIKFGKVGLDKCAACGLPVYLAQRLIVSQKLYHRRCFRCSKCSGHLNPKNVEADDVPEFICDTCKNEKSIPQFLNNNDQIGMLAFNNDVCDKIPAQKEESMNLKVRTRPLSILEKINMFEKNTENNSRIEDKIGNLSLINNISKSQLNENHISISKKESDYMDCADIESKISEKTDIASESKNVYRNMPEKTYKSNMDKFIFLQTQLSGEILDNDIALDKKNITDEKSIKDDSLDKDKDTNPITDVTPNKIIEQEYNITDDSRLAQNISSNQSNVDSTYSIETSDSIKNDQEITISVPPRRKKNVMHGENKVNSPRIETKLEKVKVYPDHLNPFSEDEEEMLDENNEAQRRVSTNPFGSSDEDEDVAPQSQPIAKPANNHQQTSTPIKRHITAHNPFWSDGEEPSSDEEQTSRSSSMYKSSITTSTPNLPASTPRRRKPKAPPPPAVIAEQLHVPATSMDDVASISSFSSHTSTVHSDQKSFGVSTPLAKKKRPAPTPPDSLSTMSGAGGSLEKGVDTSGACSNISDGGREAVSCGVLAGAAGAGGAGGAGGARRKGPAPGLPLPARRAVRLQLSPDQLQAQLDLLETQQLGLERQGVLIEQMIRDKCEGDEASTVPQEEVEDLVIQLCELVNEKNDLFRKQTELMYIRRQQRLEQEQADIEHEIRVIQSQPAVNRIDADKAREEQLVCRLVEIVRLRDELVQQLDAERRRERQEDIAIAASIATKRAQRNSDSNSSSMKSAEASTTGKKSKVKDKMKKHLKKAKHTFISKKKEEDKEKEKKSK